jgi:hypothetical protein
VSIGYRNKKEEKKKREGEGSKIRTFFDLVEVP